MYFLVEGKPGGFDGFFLENMNCATLRHLLCKCRTRFYANLCSSTYILHGSILGHDSVLNYPVWMQKVLPLGFRTISSILILCEKLNSIFFYNKIFHAFSLV